MKTILSLLAATFLLSACGGGGSGSGNGTGDPAAGLNHNQLAERFVTALNATGSYSVQAVKNSTNQANFIVVKDLRTNEFTAININGYTSGSDVEAFLSGTTTYRGLQYIPAIPGGSCGSDSWICDSGTPEEYFDRGSGLYFEKVQGSNKDLEAAGALAEEAVVEMRAEEVANRFGLSMKRGKEVVRLAMAWQNAGGKDLTEADQDAFSTDILGFSITEAKSATASFLAGDTKALEELVETAAVTNETTPENINQLITEYFGIN
jgi:hypothetical protein